MAKIEQKLDGIVDTLNENKQDHEKLYKAIENSVIQSERRFAKLDDKYAAKYVEKIFWMILSSLLLLFLSALWYLVVKV